MSTTSRGRAPFNSYLFACFFAVVLLVHHSPLPWTVREVCLLVFSYAFYAAWDPPFVLLLIASTIVDGHVARAMARSEVHTRRKAFLLISLVFNLGLLAFFKYSALALATLTDLVDPMTGGPGTTRHEVRSRGAEWNCCLFGPRVGLSALVDATRSIYVGASPGAGGRWLIATTPR